MQKLGYIVTKGSVREIPNYIGVVSSVDEVEDKTKPILIVGYKNAKNDIKDFSILRKSVNDRLFWTFGKTENHEDYLTDIRNFCQYCVKYAISSVEYTYINVLTISRNTIKKMLQKLYSEDSLCIYIGEGMVYCCKGNKVAGVSLSILSYCGIDYNRVAKIVTRNKKNKVFFSAKGISYELMNTMKNNKYALAYFLSS